MRLTFHLVSLFLLSHSDFTPILIIYIFSIHAVKEKHAKQLQEQKADYQAMSDLTAEQHRKKMDRYKAQLHDVKQKMLSVSHQWEDRLDKLDAELAIANDRVVAQKSKYRNLMQQQRDQAKDFATQVQNRLKWDTTAHFGATLLLGST